MGCYLTTLHCPDIRVYVLSTTTDIKRQVFGFQNEKQARNIPRDSTGEVFIL
jgi:hypothetical protein